MLARRYEARTIEEALALVQEDLGTDAVVLYSHERRRAPWSRWFGAGAEVIAMAPPAAGDPDTASPLCAVGSPSAAAGPPLRPALAAPIRIAKGRCRRVALVGATGVGKTTTIAKLATAHTLRGHRVGLIAADAYRMSAVGHLAGYARVLRIPLRAADGPASAVRARELLVGCDLVLVDLPGVHPSRPDRFAAAKSILEAVRPHETHLVLAATAGAEVIEITQQQLAALRPARAILTHIDEVTPTHLAEVLRAVALPVSYVGFGPNVPGDLATARSRSAATWLVAV